MKKMKNVIILTGTLAVLLCFNSCGVIQNTGSAVKGGATGGIQYSPEEQREITRTADTPVDSDRRMPETHNLSGRSLAGGFPLPTTVKIREQ
jgi:hypothetical protein